MRTTPFSPRGRWWTIAAASLLAAPALADLPTDKPPALDPDRQALTQPLPTEKPPPAERTAADITGPACIADHRALIDDALAEARTRLEAAIRLVREEPDHAHLRRWFGDAPRKAVLMTLELTAERLAAPDSFEIHCNDPSGCPGGRFAYARQREPVIGLCPTYFQARMEGTDSRWGILIHEASHIAANTSDHAYRPNGALVLAKQDPLRAAGNADNYEYFVETLPR
jgi:hypothetical protein